MPIGNTFNKTLLTGTKLDVSGKSAGALPFSSDANGTLGYIAPGTATQFLIGGSSPSFVDPTEIIQDVVGSLIVNGSVISSTYSDAGNTLTLGIANNAVTNAMLAQLAGTSVLANSTGATANVAALTATSDGQVLLRQGGTLSFTQLTAGSFANNTISPARLTNAAAYTVVGNNTGASAANTNIPISSLGSLINPVTTVTGTTQAIATNNTYIANNASQIVFTLPATSVVGDTVTIFGLGAGGWRINNGVAGATITQGDITGTAGTTGYIRSGHSRDMVQLFCVVANTGWVVSNCQGNIYFDE